jgi:hypothetical protein
MGQVPSAKPNFFQVLSQLFYGLTAHPDMTNVSLTWDVKISKPDSSGFSSQIDTLPHSS